MGKKVYVIGIIILVIIGIMMIVPSGEKIKDTEKVGESVTLNSLDELFSNKIGETYTYKEGEEEYKVKVTNIEINEETKVVTTQREVKEENNKYIVEMKYEIGKEKIVERGSHIKDGKKVSTIYATEILVDGMPYEGKTWKSVDGLIEYKITSMKDNKVTIEAIRDEIKEIRVLEVGKGIVELRSE